MEAVSFDPSDDIQGGIRVLILSLGGESFDVKVQQDVTIIILKLAIAAKFDLTVFEFHLTAVDCETPPHDSTVISTLLAHDASGSSEMTQSDTVSMYMIKSPMMLQQYEEKSSLEWCEVAAQLQDLDIDDDKMLVSLRAFLDMYPALVNWQSTCRPGLQGVFRPLLFCAVQASLNARQQCIEELIKRGARVHIRHEPGFLVDTLVVGELRDYLVVTRKSLKAYEKESIKAWRHVSSRLCGECETSEQVHDDDEMARIVEEFCTKYPEMVNFQNNHAIGANDVPVGYFGYAPLIAFAGAQACRQRRGMNDTDSDKAVRKSSVEVLLRHGARVGVQHGGRTSLEWMKAEGSLLVDWLQQQLLAPMPPQVPFKFERSLPAGVTGKGNSSKCTLQ